MINRALIIFAFGLGCTLTFYGHQFFSISPVLSSSLVGLLGSFVVSRKYSIVNHLPAAIYSGSFAGMCTSEVIQNTWDMVSTCIIGGFFYLLIDKYLKGIGGKLGAVAFTSVAIIFLIKKGILS
jgi:hypothetical protein